MDEQKQKKVSTTSVLRSLFLFQHRPFPTIITAGKMMNKEEEVRFIRRWAGALECCNKNGVVRRGCRRSSPRFCPGGAVGRVICFVPPLHSLLSTSPPPLIPPTHACASLLPPHLSLSLSLSLLTMPPTPTHVNDNAKKQNKTKQRKKGFKKSIDVDEGRRRREETTLQIRKTTKDARLAKRRQLPGAGGAEGGGMGGASDTPAGLAAASMLAAGGVAPGGYGECC